MLPVSPTSAQVRPRRVWVLAALWVAASLSGCAPTPVEPPPPTPGQQLESQALDAIDAGDPQLAAELYERLAEQSEGSTRVDYLLAAARQGLAANELASAARWLERAAGSATPQQRLEVTLLDAELALRRQQPELVLARLAQLPEPTPPSLQPQALGLKGRALFALDRLPEAVSALVERERLLSRPEDVLANQRFIWEGLSAAPLSDTPSPQSDPVIAGWLALQPAAVAARGNPFMLQPALADWSERYPGHPAGQLLVDDLLLSMQLLTNYPEQLALLLPLSGRQQSAAKAVRDGLFAAHMTGSGIAGPRLRIYDTSRLGATQAYLQAEQDGADFIVGPLLKTAVEEVLNAAGRTPTLALNFAAAELEAPPNLFQFALAPEDEAAEVARQAISAGQTRSVALVANNDWGIRVLTSFRDEYQALGGTLLEFKGYDPQGQDFTGAITSLLQLDQSVQRQRRLAANLGQPVEFQPRRRRDVDLIFLAAAAGSARLLRPQLRFHYAQDLPTYATSEVYAPGDPRSNRDLNGVRFPDIPWIVEPDESGAALRAAIEAYWPQRGPRLIRLYAMGFDAYRLIPLLYNKGDMITLRLQGLSGLLTMDARGRVHRQLAWAEFRGGQPTPFEPLAEPEGIESTAGQP